MAPISFTRFLASALRVGLELGDAATSDSLGWLQRVSVSILVVTAVVASGGFRAGGKPSPNGLDLIPNILVQTDRGGRGL